MNRNVLKLVLDSGFRCVGFIALSGLGAMMRLGRWQKIGVVLSILWVIGAAIYQRNSDINQAQSYATFSYQACTMYKELKNGPALCDAKKEETLSKYMKDSWPNVAILSLGLLPIWWLVGTIFVYFVSALTIAFRIAVPMRTMTVPKKSFAYFCCLFAAVLLLFCLTALLNLYTEAHVPVGLDPTKNFFVNATGDWVNVTGTWVQSGDGSESIQTSTISCRREERKCVEARSTVVGGSGAGGVLMSDLYEYPIESWSDTTVVFQDDGLCISTIYTIDLKTEAVSGADQPVKNPISTCTVGNASRSYQLVAGFPVYWAKREAARPYLLRLIQAAFGH